MKAKKAKKEGKETKQASNTKLWIGAAAAVVIVILLVIALSGNSQKKGQNETPMGAAEQCGDLVCGAKESSTGSCPADCKVAEKEYEAKLPGEETQSDGCIKEGDGIPLVPNAPECCAGLTLIAPKQSSVLGISGICTAKCGNGVCDDATESPKNCPADCTAVQDAMPVCDGVGTSKEGWYQNDKILIYAKCGGCSAECRNKDTLSEGWYNICDGKQIKRYCN